MSDSGLALTNYHVVSQYALEPQSYELQYLAADGRKGKVELLAFDVVNDVALIRIDRSGLPFFRFDARTLSSSPPKGERLYSMGNPLDLGFTIVEGTYNGPVERSYNERVLFSGAMNPGMSGGPTVSSANRIVGLNVSKRLDGELVSFLVPARFAAELVGRAGRARALSAQAIRAEITRQLTAWQAGLYRAIGEQPTGRQALGPYRAFEPTAAWFSCWGYTNANREPPPRATAKSTSCRTDTSLFIANDLNTGVIAMTHSYVRTVDLNAFQFAAFLSQYYRSSSGGWNRKRHTHTQCHDAFIAAAQDRPALRATWCARAYRDFEGLYDVTVLAVTQDSAAEALAVRLSMQGVAYDNAEALAQRLLHDVRRER